MEGLVQGVQSGERPAEAEPIGAAAPQPGSGEELSEGTVSRAAVLAAVATCAAVYMAASNFIKIPRLPLPKVPDKKRVKEMLRDDIEPKKTLREKYDELISPREEVQGN